MNSVTVGVPVVAGSPDAAIPAPFVGGPSQCNYSRPGGANLAPPPPPGVGYRAPGAAPRPGERAEGLSCPAGARLPPEAERALAELENALDLHGRPCPERTAAWLAAGAPVRP